jgi:hypothetical protein
VVVVVTATEAAAAVVAAVVAVAVVSRHSNNSLKAISEEFEKVERRLLPEHSPWNNQRYWNRCAVLEVLGNP